MLNQIFFYANPSSNKLLFFNTFDINSRDTSLYESYVSDLPSLMPNTSNPLFKSIKCTFPSGYLTVIKFEGPAAPSLNVTFSLNLNK